MASGQPEERKGGWGSIFRRARPSPACLLLWLHYLPQALQLSAAGVQSSSGKRVNKAKLGEKNTLYYDEQVLQLAQITAAGHRPPLVC